MVTPYFWRTVSLGKLSKVQRPSSASAGPAARQIAAARRLRRMAFPFRLFGNGLRVTQFGAAAAVPGEHGDQILGDGGKIRHVPAKLTDEAVGIHVLTAFARQVDDTIVFPLAQGTDGILAPLDLLHLAL